MRNNAHPNATSESSGLTLTNPSHAEPRHQAKKKIKHNFPSNNFRIVYTAFPPYLNISEIIYIIRGKPTLSIHYSKQPIY